MVGGRRWDRSPTARDTYLKARGVTLLGGASTIAQAYK